jgi:hypothetical protein
LPLIEFFTGGLGGPMRWGFAAGCLAVAVSPASAATLSRAVDVPGEPSAVWSAIGPFCAIQTWHPAIGTCVTDGKSPPTRILLTRDGGARFVELQIARNDREHRYAYTFVSSPAPVTGYRSTFQVVPRRGGGSTVTWSGSYTPNPGHEQEASQMLSAIYDSGLAAIKARLSGGRPVVDARLRD